MIFFKTKYFCKYAFIFLFFSIPSIIVSETYLPENEIFGKSNNFSIGGGAINGVPSGVGEWDFSCGSRRTVEEECYTDGIENSCKLLRVCIKYPRDYSW